MVSLSESSTPSCALSVTLFSLYITLDFPLMFISSYTVILRGFRHVPRSIFDVDMYEDSVAMEFVRRALIGPSEAAAQIPCDHHSSAHTHP